ncbi:hypothetical protein L1049_022396 [Liquidambar formosana]|uniref:Transmembrane protein n=1 Tax=Liquidambar formosana TaxID=63359 RepID=A0AAP0WNS6_LIQFO
MEELKKVFREVSKDAKLGSSSSSSSSSSEGRFYGGGGGGGGGVSALSSDQSRVLATRAPRQVVSLWTCSKLCVICFVTGIVVGYTLKRRVRRWASRLLKRIKDD